MQKLCDLENGKRALIKGVTGDARFLSRVTSVGLTAGCRIEVLQNVRKRPVLVFARDSAIAVDRADSERIEVEVVA